MVFLGYTTFTCHTLVLLHSPEKWSNDNKDIFRSKRKGRRENERMMEHDLQVTLCLSCHPHTLWTLLGHSRRYWKVEEVLEAIWEGGTPTPLMVERSQLRFNRLGVLENKHAWWHDALWLHSAGCEHRDRKWKITAAHTMAMARNLRRLEPSDFHPDWLFPLHGVISFLWKSLWILGWEEMA